MPTKKDEYVDVECPNCGAHKTSKLKNKYERFENLSFFVKKYCNYFNDLI